MILPSIQSPQDLKKLSIEQLTQLAGEIREFMVQTVSKTGGHLGSSLGAVEIIIALHYCLNAPEDKIVFDVGHQAYAHKIITGRKESFSTLRQQGGVSGFPTKEESEYDVFTSGHSSDAVSLALGLASGRDYPVKKDHPKVVALIGDGSLSGGLCFEGLNNAGHLKKDILVILNTNELSIAPNVGAISNYLNKVISLPLYNRFRTSLEKFVKSRVPKGRRLITIANRFEEGLKGFFIPGMLFEELGFRYFGPFDGHNLAVLIPTLKNILMYKGPRIVHVVTKKGKGYVPAEKDPVRFHGVSAFDIATGNPLSKSTQKTYTEVFSAKILESAGSDDTIVALTAAMPEGTGLDKFRDAYPERFFDVGIAESHAICFASGLAHAGLKPVVAVYSTFLQRAYDQLIENVALQKAPVVIAVDRAGIVGEDGLTHQGIFDISFLRTIPDLVIIAPKDRREFEMMIDYALALNKPVVIRYPKASCPESGIKEVPLETGKAELLRSGPDFLLCAVGSMVLPSLQAAAFLEKEGYTGTVINARFIKPLDESFYATHAADCKHVFSVEEGVVDGGFGSALGEILNMPVARLGLPCEFVAHAPRAFLLERYGLTAEAIAARIRGVLGKGHGSSSAAHKGSMAHGKNYHR